MPELTSYSGEFDPSIRYQDFSRGLLVKALGAYASYIRRLDGHWYLTVKDRADDDLAIACDRQVWETMEIHDVGMVCKLFKIEGNDIAAYFNGIILLAKHRTAPSFGVADVFLFPLGPTRPA